MRTFTCLFNDNRYTVPTLSFLLTADDERARDFAKRQLAENRHYSQCEVRDGDRVVCTEARCA